MELDDIQITAGGFCTVDAATAPAVIAEAWTPAFAWLSTPASFWANGNDLPP